MSIFSSLVKASLSPVSIAASVVADAVTLGGTLTDKEKPYTAEACSDLMKNIKDMTEPKSKY